jgi:uracil-DNA glycosylase family 4
MDIVMANKPSSAVVAIIGTNPGHEELRVGTPFVGETGKILRAEFLRHNVNIHRFVLSNLWLHTIPKSVTDRAGGIEWHKQQLLKALGGVKAVFLMGAACSHEFLGCGILKVSSLSFHLQWNWW